MAVQAVYKGVRMSPRKVGVVAALVRGRSLADAVVILDHTPRRAATAVKKAVVSAGANAEHNHNYKPDSLYISEISVTPGIRYRRYRAAARGRALRFARSTSQIRVTVDGQKRVVKKPAAKAEKEAK
ncbi:MAG TPA: 50S ribosomal protein L22 [Candidatus Saccharimonadales bacterium]|nr:50S ribosomal protein L22 [Candidatus Saccharimonadales bacterium]